MAHCEHETMTDTVTITVHCCEVCGAKAVLLDEEKTT